MRTPAITVLVPTYRRPQDLRRCLDALRAQTRPADEVLVTVRDTDDETRAFFAAFDPGGLPLRTLTVGEPGVIAAMNAGLEAARGDIFALTDDDAAPRPDWLARIAAHFAADPKLGGVGGRDHVCYEDGHWETRTHPNVGHVQWHGRVVGNHHLGFGPPRPVDLLKGVNNAYRAEALRPLGFDRRLRGSGAQVHWELSLGLTLKRDGWKLLYDPAVAVDHYPAARLDTDTNNRGIFHAATHEDIVYNETVVLAAALPSLRRAAYLAWSALVGTAVAPGLLQVLRLAARRDRHAWVRWRATRAGRAAGLRLDRGSSVGGESRGGVAGAA